MLSMRSIVRRQAWVSAFVLLIVASLLAACSASTYTPSPSTPTSQPTATIPDVTITAKDFSFAMPDTLQTGLVDLTLTNQGTQPHQAQLERLNNGVTQVQVLAAFNKGPAAFLPLLSSYGGANVVEPGQRQEVILSITQGQYVMLCFVSGPDKITHVIKGMYKFFTVTGPSNTNQMNQPQVNGQVMLRNFSIALPASIPAGPLMLQVANQGSQPHEMGLLKLMPGKTMKDALAFLLKPAGPPPFERAGGMGALNPGMSGWVKLNLAPGYYVALCFVPDRATGTPHFALGMITSFSVQ